MNHAWDWSLDAQRLEVLTPLGSAGTARHVLRPRARTSRSALFLGVVPPPSLPLALLWSDAPSADAPRLLAWMGGGRCWPAEVWVGDEKHTGALWVEGLDEARALEACAALNLAPGLLVLPDERAVGLGHAPPVDLWLHAAPSVALQRADRMADNTSPEFTLKHLLQRAVGHYGGGSLPYKVVQVTTGYLFEHGLQKLAELAEGLQGQAPKLQLLFSGKADSASVRELSDRFSQQLGAELQDAPDGRWDQLRRVVEAGRFEVRVYQRAFLHAKLFLAWSKRNLDGEVTQGVGIVGSSNVTWPGMEHQGNLELNVALDDHHRLTALANWFEVRWAESDALDPSLLEIVEQHRPKPRPKLREPALADLQRALDAATEAADAPQADPTPQDPPPSFLGPEAHLGFLASLYKDRLALASWDPSQVFVVPDGGRAIDPSPEQEEGVLMLAWRLQQARVAFLADSVGLGKTITALGTAWYLKRAGLASRVVLVSPRKLWPQWESDRDRVGAPSDLYHPLNRHALERADEAQAARLLEGADLLLVEEAHESLRNRRNRLWLHLRAFLGLRRSARVLLISATPWNNRREDIYNYLSLAWADGALLPPDYPGLRAPPLRPYPALFQLQPTTGARAFDQLARRDYRAVFGAVFVQRTRAGIERARGLDLDFPARVVHAHQAPASPAHDAFFAKLRDALLSLELPYQQPFSALWRAAASQGLGLTKAEPTTLRRTLVTNLYKRAESSLFALAVSLAKVRHNLARFGAELQALEQGPAPRAALEAWLREVWLRLEDADPDAEPDPEQMSAAEKTRYNLLVQLLAALDDAGTRATLAALRCEQVEPDLAQLDALRALLSWELDRADPKLATLLHHAQAHAFGEHKPILVGGFADSALRAFITLCAQLPRVRVGLALGGDEAWIYEPSSHTAAALSPQEWVDACDERDAQKRRLKLLGDAGRASPLNRAALLDRFAPVARRPQGWMPGVQDDEVAVLVGSDAISVGQNLQDSTALLHLDLPWNPMLLEQRIGRIDRRGGGRTAPNHARRIVEVRYCWSLAAIEQEVALRDRLKAKAEGALEDTNFDELLLYELKDKIEAARARRLSDDELGAQLDAAQREAVGQLGRDPQAPEDASADTDGARLLSQWVGSDPSRRAWLDAAPPAPPLLCVQRAPSSPWRWALTVKAEPLDGDGRPLGGAPLWLHLALGEPLPEALPPSMLDAVVRGLSAPQGAGQRAPTRRQYDEALAALEPLLAQTQARLLAEHNDGARARMSAPSRPTRDPSEDLRLRVADAAQAVKEALLKRTRSAEGLAWFKAEKERLEFLLKVALAPGQAHRLLSFAASDVELQRSLRALQQRADEALSSSARLDEHFEPLCGAMYAEREEPAQAALALPPSEGLWADLRLSVQAATWNSAHQNKSRSAG